MRGSGFVIRTSQEYVEWSTAGSHGQQQFRYSRNGSGMLERIAVRTPDARTDSAHCVIARSGCAQLWLSSVTKLSICDADTSRFASFATCFQYDSRSMSDRS